MRRTYSQIHPTDKYSEHDSIIWSVSSNGSLLVYDLSDSGFKSSCSHLNFRFCLSFDLGDPWHSCNYRVWNHWKMQRDMRRTYSQIHPTDKYSEHDSLIWSVSSNGSLFVYELCDSEFESSCSHFNFRFCACFKQGVSWHSGNYEVWIHSEKRTWHYKNIQSNAKCIVQISSPNTAQTFG